MPKKNKTSCLQVKIEAAANILIAQVCPPRTGDAGVMRGLAKSFVGKVHALGVCDDRDAVGMSALVAASLVSAEGVEAILHVVTRDRNRIALASDCLGASALGISNVLCTSGTHQTLGAFRAARNVHDIDSVQLIQMYANPSASASWLGEKDMNACGPFCVGGVAAPFADPLDLQVTRLAKKIAAGAKFLVTGPIFDLDRFNIWWQEVAKQGLHEKVAFIAGVSVLTSSLEAVEFAQRRPLPQVPQAILDRLASKSGADQQRAEGLAIACETIDRLRDFKGLRGFDVSGDTDPAAALAVIQAAGLKAD